MVHHDHANQPVGSRALTSTIYYTVRAYGRQAELRVSAARANGSINILFTGSYSVRTFQRNDGTSGTAYEVDADTVAVTLGQNITLTQDKLVQGLPSARSGSHHEAHHPG